MFFSTHAEMCVIYKILKSCKLQTFKDFVDLSDYCIVVVRYGKDGTLRNSRPCNHCLEVMKFYKIKKIHYSTDEGTVLTEKPHEMISTHVSSGWSAFNNPERLK
jgi:cytidine deaminase